MSFTNALTCIGNILSADLKIIMNLHQDNNSSIELLTLHIFEHFYIQSLTDHRIHLGTYSKDILQLNHTKQTCCISDNNILILFNFYRLFAFQDFKRE